VVVQDDASFLAFARPGDEARVLALPRGPGGRRQFGDRRGNKLDKLDLELVVAVATPIGDRVLALGSGSLEARERVVVCDPTSHATPEVVDAGPFYDALRRIPGFAGSELNLEGVVAIGDVLRFFQRGNGEAAGATTFPSTVDVELRPFIRWVSEPDRALPALVNVARYDLGALDGARFGFTDASRIAGSRIVYLSSAERSPDTIRDGEVVGSRVGWIDGGVARWAPLLDETGVAAPWKAEGIAIDPADPRRAFIVLDPDDPDVPGELCETRLEGPWLE
jgi:hypothetical protein